MKITETQNNLKLDIKPMTCDEDFSPPVPPPLINKPHVYLFCGSKGAGKSSLVFSLLCSDKSPHRAYYQTQDSVYLCIPENSLHSCTYKAIKEHDKIYNDFNIEFLEEIDSLTQASALEEDPLFSLCVIDDASSALKANKPVIDKFTSMIHRHRHSRASYWILLQDMLSLNLSIRRNICGVFFFKPNNSKSATAFVEEFLGDFSKDEVKELFDYVFDKKNNFLFVKTGVIPEYYKNFNRLEINKSENNNIED